MKKLLYTCLLIIFSTCLYAQADSNLQAFIKKNGYVQLTDKKNLPQILIPWYETIMDTLTIEHPQLKHFYIHTNTITNNAEIISMIIYPLTGIKQVKEQEDKNIKSRIEDLKRPDTSIEIKGKLVRLKIQTIDDYGGSNGELLFKLDKKTHKISLFSFQ